MVDQSRKTKNKRLSKGQRTHVRRLKQAARKEVSTNTPRPSPAKPVRVHKEQDQS